MSTTGLRIQATTATFGFLPAARSFKYPPGCRPEGRPIFLLGGRQTRKMEIKMPGFAPGSVA